MAALKDKTVLVIGRGSGIARAVTLLSLAERARVIVAGRNRDTLAAAYDDPGVTAETVDITDDASIAALAEDGKRDYFATMSASNPTGTIGTAEDVAGAVLFAMTNTFLTGMTLKIDGGEPLT